jgi:hypothetical protein
VDTLLSPLSSPPVLMEQTECPARATLQVVYEAIWTVPTSLGSLEPVPLHSVALTLSIFLRPVACKWLIIQFLWGPVPE